MTVAVSRRIEIVNTEDGRRTFGLLGRLQRSVVLKAQWKGKLNKRSVRINNVNVLLSDEKKAMHRLSCLIRDEGYVCSWDYRSDGDWMELGVIAIPFENNLGVKITDALLWSVSLGGVTLTPVDGGIEMMPMCVLIGRRKVNCEDF